jgi:hypothetical protein
MFFLSIILCSLTSNAEQLWSLKPVTVPAVPQVRQNTWVRNPVDHFILAGLESKGLAPSPEASRRVLIRRLSFDLLGMPPSPEQIEAFVNDPTNDAYEKLVERFLESPRFGERWARHWLDIAHYADTHGFERDRRRDHAWPYRDYVIAALNNDKPYNLFLAEQIAGDALAPQNPESIVATGFLAAGPWDFVGQQETKSPKLRRAARADDLDDMVTQVMTATVGMTVNCARCHDHKLDPIPQKDYYRLWAVFAGVKRGDRAYNAGLVEEREKSEQRLKDVVGKLAELEGRGIDLSDLVAKGDGLGTGQKYPYGIDVRNGKFVKGSAAYLKPIVPNKFFEVAESEFIDGVSVPDGGKDGKQEIQISSTGISVTGITDTNAETWDYVLNGKVRSQAFSVLDGVDYASPGHTLLGLHANKLISFDLNAVRKVHKCQKLRFRTIAGYGGKDPNTTADFRVFVDGKLRAARLNFGKSVGGTAVEFDIDPDERFLTLMATDAGNAISHDQIYFGDPALIPTDSTEKRTPEEEQQLATLKTEEKELRAQIKKLSEQGKVYATVSSKPPVVHILKRGDPEEELEAVQPGALSSVDSLFSELGNDATPEGKRRLALADWITDPDNPLTRRVIVNRLWHYHFGKGLVDTPSDFGGGGSKPSHPELLDWLATELLTQKWSLKAIHKLILLSHTYRQQSTTNNAQAEKIDADNRLLWRKNQSRLDAESLRDTVLAVSGKLNLKMGGPGYEDFKYTSAYAPIYRYITPDEPKLWRRSIYRYVVRSTPNTFMTTLDCPNPANLSPVRLNTNTALQSLALLNNDFMLRQAGYFAERLSKEGSTGSERVTRAFLLAFGRQPDATEIEQSLSLINARGLFAFSRALLNANEFVYVD